MEHEITYCKDCKHWKDGPADAVLGECVELAASTSDLVVIHDPYSDGIMTAPLFFCALGEAK